MRKAQGALEYLIIIAAVLAIAAIVVLFITGALGGVGRGGDVAKCRVAAATCANSVASGVYQTKAQCLTSCQAACYFLNGTLVVPFAIDKCQDGNVSQLQLS